MSTLKFYFTDENGKALPPMEVKLKTDYPGVEELLVNTFLGVIGPRSMQPMQLGIGGKNLYLAFIYDEKGNQLFYNADNFNF